MSPDRLWGLGRFTPVGQRGRPRARKVACCEFFVNCAIVEYHGPSEYNCVDHVLGLTEGTMGLLFLFIGYAVWAAV